VLITLQEKVRDYVSTRARLLTSGAFIVTEFEGPNVDGNYSVLVGMIWSVRLAKIAEAIINPAIKLDPQEPDLPISKQIEKLTAANPTWMATAHGVRVWTDENGERVIIGFGSASGTSSTTIDRDRAALAARAAIQRFVGELVETAATDKNEMTYQEGNQAKRVFDSSSYERRIEAKSQEINISGSNIVAQWRDNHPFGRTRLQAVAVMWSPTAAGIARDLGNQMQRKERNQQGDTVEAPASTQTGRSIQGPINPPVIQGPSSNPSKF
jgi:hypothetical protein